MEQSQQMTLTDKLQQIQESWTSKIESLNASMKNLAGLDGLLNDVYAQRQNIVDYYTNLMMTLAKYSRDYNKRYAELYNNYKSGNGTNVRYTSDSAINVQIEAALIEYKANVQTLNFHAEYIKETIKTIDNMIYGINHKINLYKLMNGIKSI